MAYSSKISQTANYTFITAFKDRIKERFSEGCMIVSYNEHNHTKSYMIAALIEWDNGENWLIIGDDGNASRIGSYIQIEYDRVYDHGSYRSDVKTHIKECSKVKDVKWLYDRYCDNANEVMWVD